MKEITKYVSDDGKEFYTKEECMMHDNIVNNLMRYAETIKDYCGSRDGCPGCVFSCLDDDGEQDCVLMTSEPPLSWDVDCSESNDQKTKLTSYTDAPTYRGLPEYDD